MNRTVDKWTVDTARYFKDDVLDIMPDVPSEKLSDIAGKHVHVYYQHADIIKY